MSGLDGWVGESRFRPAAGLRPQPRGWRDCCLGDSDRGVFRLPRGPSLPSANEIESTVVSRSDVRRVGIRQREASPWGTGGRRWLWRTLSPAVVRVRTARRRAVIGVQDRAGQKRRAQQHRQDQQIRQQHGTAWNEYPRQREEDQNRH